MFLGTFCWLITKAWHAILPQICFSYQERSREELSSDCQFNVTTENHQPDINQSPPTACMSWWQLLTTPLLIRRMLKLYSLTIILMLINAQKYTNGFDGSSASIWYRKKVWMTEVCVDERLHDKAIVTSSSLQYGSSELWLLCVWLIILHRCCISAFSADWVVLALAHQVSHLKEYQTALGHESFECTHTLSLSRPLIPCGSLEKLALALTAIGARLACECVFLLQQEHLHTSAVEARREPSSSILTDTTPFSPRGGVNRLHSRNQV